MKRDCNRLCAARHCRCNFFIFVLLLILNAGWGNEDAGSSNSWKGHSRYLPANVGQVGDYPIQAFGKVYVYTVSPDFQPDNAIQANNANPVTKIHPKKSWELVDSHLGSMVSWQPRTPENDFQPFLSIHLIDGNPKTSWRSRVQSRP